MVSYLQVPTNCNDGVASMQSLSCIDLPMIHVRGLPEKRLNSADCVLIVTLALITFELDGVFNLR